MSDPASPNTYSAEWFEHFHVGIPAARTEQEAAFVQNVCPLPEYTRVLDVCCGMGRHARALAARGYTVTGIERDSRAVEEARRMGGGPTYLKGDVLDYQPTANSFDALILLSHSFGYFDPGTNGDLLARLAIALHPGGRVVLDLWNPDFFRTRLEPRRFDLPAGSVLETKRMEADRLFTRLDYPGGGHDAFEFQTFTTAEMAAFARPLGLMLTTACTNFDAAFPPSPDQPKIQFVLEHR